MHRNFDKLTGKTATLTPESALVLSAIAIIAVEGVIDEAEHNDLARIVRGDRKSMDVAMEVMRANKFPGVIDLAEPRWMRNSGSQRLRFSVILP